MNSVRSVLVVCAANICRSPAAASLLRAELALRDSDVVVTSAGVTALGGRPACDLALALVGEFAQRDYAFAGTEQVATAGVPHRSRRIDTAMVDGVDLVVVMEEWQRDAVRALAPLAAVRLLDEVDIADPHAIGYQAHPMVMRQLGDAVRRLADELT